MMTQNQAVTLPVELHDMILSALLRLDGKSARPLSSVCHHWRMQLYKSIFADIHLDQLTAIPFSRLLAGSFSCLAILPSVRNLHLNTNGQRPWSDTDIVIIKHLLVQFALRTNLSSLALSDVDGAGKYQLDITSLSLPSFSSVNTVKLCRIIFKEPSSFRKLFALFPAVKHVEFNGILCPWSNEHWSELPPGEFALNLVVYSASSHRTNIQWTLTDPIASIKMEDLCSLGQLTTADMPTLLRQIGPALRELDVDFQPELMHGLLLDSVVNALDLSAARFLRRIRLGSSTHVLSCMHWVPNVLYGLSAVNNPSLKVLAIRFASSRQFHLDRPFLRFLTRGLCKRQYSAVRKIHFIAHHDCPFDQCTERAITQSIQAELPHYHKQGLVRITFCAREDESDDSVGRSA
ncbi:hypothetical protein HYPSUDRAFT_435296 [Hypholoma sublateritium FD-334 SS-4]|uniref:F-box domain-containing protein n=1 Tax=Hypholoma sublateritium (strain FD-334 SS-4) TaxID=945553 RepID=A0A0D2P299_HYPSF|nr:hypothetical protein HYPSUDRAFT_435296 [Hypholoma sublateritium FD-334 SS-4]